SPRMRPIAVVCRLLLTIGFVLLFQGRALLAGQSPTCPCAIWPNTATPAIQDTGVGPAVELGVRFTTSTSGQISGIRFYKGAHNTGTHTAQLWSNTGTLRASATFSGEPAAGWQQVNFSSPVMIAANTVYVAS